VARASSSDTTAAVALSRGGAAQRTLGQRLLAGRLAYLFVLPALAMVLLFSYYPALSALYHGFTQWDGTSPAIWVGLSNFHSFVNDQQFGTAVGNIVQMMAYWVILALTVPLIVARLILGIRSPRLQFICRLCFVLPFVVPQVVTILLWRFIYADTGVLNELLKAVNLTNLQQDWLGSPAYVVHSIMFMGGGVVAAFPYVDGFGLLIYTAGLQAIPGEVKEAAAVDGASSLRTFFAVELPQIKGQLRLILVLTLIYGIQNYVQVLIMTQGGPGYVSTVPGLMMYQDAFSNQDFGQASAIGTSLFLIILALTIINLRVGRKGEAS
jgi:ABC-type sugar transport system permease subunit